MMKYIHKITALLLVLGIAAPAFTGCGDTDDGDDAGTDDKSVSDSADDEDEDGQEETTKRVRKRQPKDEEEDTTEDKSASDSADDEETESYDSCLIDDAGLFSKSEKSGLAEYIEDTSAELELNICVYVAGSGDADLTDEETELFADNKYDELFGEGSDGVFYYLDMSEGDTAYDYISTSGRAIGMYQNDIDSIFECVDRYLPASGEEIVPDDIYAAVQAFCDQLIVNSGEDNTTEPETKAPDSEAALGLMDIIKLRMSAEDAEEIMSEQYDGEPVKTEGYYMTYSLSYPLSDVLGTGLDGYFFLEFGEKDDQLKCYGYHIGAVGDPEKPDYPYDEAELKAAFDQIENILIEQYGESTQDNGLEEMGVKKEYSTTLSDGMNVWAIYGTDLWATDAPSGINEAVVSYSVPDSERY